MRAYEFLAEALSPAAIEATVNRYGQQIMDKLAKDRQGSAWKDDPSKFVQYVANDIDPTTNSRYTKWIISRFVDQNGGIPFIEDLSKLTEPLGRYAKLSQSGIIPAESRDINRIKSMDTFLDLMDQYAEQKTGREEKSNEEQELIKSGQAVLYKDTGKVKIMIPKTEEAAKFYGRGTRWCTAGDNSNQFEYYNRRGPLYDIIFRGSGVKWQFHFETNQFKDEGDKDLSFVQMSSAYDLFPEDKWIKLVEKNPLFIINFENPPENLQMAALLPLIRSGPWNIKFINNPTEAVQLAAVKYYGNMIEYFKNQNPSEAVQLAAVNGPLHGNYEHYPIEYIKNPSEEVQLAAVKRHGVTLRDIKNPTEKVLLAAVEQDYLNISLIKDPTEKVQLAAVNKNIFAIQHIEDPTEKVQLAVVRKDPRFITDIKNPTDAVKKAAGVK